MVRGAGGFQPEKVAIRYNYQKPAGRMIPEGETENAVYFSPAGPDIKIQEQTMSFPELKKNRRPSHTKKSIRRRSDRRSPVTQAPTTKSGAWCVSASLSACERDSMPSYQGIDNRPSHLKYWLTPCTAPRTSRWNMRSHGTA